MFQCPGASTATVQLVVMGISIVFFFSIQERIPYIANTMATRGNFSFHLQKVTPTAVHPYKQGGWGGWAPGVALWRRGIRPRCHIVSIAGKGGTYLDTLQLHLCGDRGRRSPGKAQQIRACPGKRGIVRPPVPSAGALSITFVSQASLDAGLKKRVKSVRQIQPVQQTRRAR